MLYIMCNIFTQMFEVHSPAFVYIIMMLLKRIRLCLIKCPHTDTHMHTHLLLSPSCLSSPSLLSQKTERTSEPFLSLNQKNNAVHNSLTGMN